ncbi:MAG: ABC transporter permease subunit [Lachnospiraceae bacterium]|nr:ABC transporter permease subunit [Lachnospiraceae bacterium]
MAREKKERVKEASITPKITRKELKRQRVLIVWSIIFVIYGVIFCYLPLGGWLMAFQKYKPKTGLLHSKFIGLDKFKFLFADATFFRVFRNTIAMGTINMITTLIMAVLFAILLNEIRTSITKKVVQTISYLPHFLSWIIVTGILHDALSSTGIVNELLVNWHVVDTYIPFFSIEKYFWGIVAFANNWKETGWNAIVYLAAITSIDPCLYEAAAIDGAGRGDKIWFITLPSIKPTIMILTLINIGNVINAGFEIQYLLGNPTIVDVSETIDIYVLRWGISQMDYSLGTAAGIFKSLVSIILILIGNSVAKVLGEERLF